MSALENGTIAYPDKKQTILLLEDDESLSRGISLKLTREGYRVFQAFDLEEAKVFWRDEPLDMVISDINLPDGSGLDFGRMVREKSDTYLIYLTALDQEIDIINGYDTGADDYITKPFSVAALVAKVNALMRRLGDRQTGLLISDKLLVSTADFSVKADGNAVALSRTETLLLIFLMENAGHIVSKESILEKVWGMDGMFVDDNTVTVNISRLKAKLKTEAISNVRGLGYLWTKDVIKK